MSLTHRRNAPASLLGFAMAATMAAGAQGTTTVAPAPATAPAAATEPLFVSSGDKAEGANLHLMLGRAVVLDVRVPLKRVYVGDPTVLQTFSPQRRQLVLTAKTTGRSSLVLWDETGRSYVYTVFADMDAGASREAFHEAFPHAAIAVEGRESRLFLSGTVPTDAASEAAFKLASVYSHDVVNALQVIPVHGKQVQLKLRIVEVDRARAEQFGINFLTGSGRTASSVSTEQFSTTVDTSQIKQGQAVSVSDPLNIFLYNYKLNFGLTVKDLESRQILQVLAEPTLTTLSGVPARFLSGGEIPVPVVQGGTGNSTALTIVYKPYGVKVDFLPVVNADGTIHVKVSPEVSALDYTNAVTLSGTTVPALSTRRAETEVEIRDGQSFIVSGLLDHRTTNSLASTPGIANIPILGQLFRSKSLNHSVVELAVLVTATVVDPLTHPETTQEPEMVVPEIDSHHFDEDVRKTLKQKPPVPAAPAPAALPSAPAAQTGAPQANATSNALADPAKGSL